MADYEKTQVTILLRLERIETGVAILKWIFGGGLVAFVGTMLLIWQAMQVMAKTHG